MLDKLKDICEVHNSSDDKVIYGADVICFPQNNEEMYKIIRLANRYKLKLSLKGAGTFRKEFTSIVIDFAKMNHIIDVNVNNKEVLIQSGVVINQLNQYLKRFNFLFPIIPFSHEVATIGGMIAVNSNNSINNFILSDYIKEIEVIDGTGKIFKTKNISEVIGTQGKYFVILSTTLKVVELNDYKIDNNYTLPILKELTEKNKYDPQGVLQ